MIINGRISDNFITQIAKKYQLFYWSGLAIWAFGYWKNQTDQRKEYNQKKH